MTSKCLKCDRVFDVVRGEPARGGFCLCVGCAHVMLWANDMTLRELTRDEHVEAGTNFDLMRERIRIGPRQGVIHRGSWLMSCLISLIVVMIILERLHVVGVLHHK